MNAIHPPPSLPAHQPTSLVGERPVSHSPARVLLVEDSVDYARLIDKTLASFPGANFQLSHEQRLDAALRCIDRCDFDAILLDLSLPDSFGATTVRTACSGAGERPVLVLTASNDARLSSAAFEAGAVDFLVKDALQRGQLPAKILTAIEHSRSGGEGLSTHRNRASLQRRLDVMTKRDPDEPLALLVVEHQPEGEQDLQRVRSHAQVVLDRCAPGQYQWTRIDENRFALTVDSIRSDAQVGRLSTALLLAFDTLAILNDRGGASRTTPASIGISIYPWDGEDGAALLESATCAQHEAARAGGACYRFRRRGERN